MVSSVSLQVTLVNSPFVARDTRPRIQVDIPTPFSSFNSSFFHPCISVYLFRECSLPC
jgi:hypothetical protein